MNYLVIQVEQTPDNKVGKFEIIVATPSKELALRDIFDLKEADKVLNVDRRYLLVEIPGFSIF